MFAIKVGTIYIPIHQVPKAAVKDTAADLLIVNQKHTPLPPPLRPWEIVSPEVWLGLGLSESFINLRP